jgi:exonuclease SbcD
MRILHTSDWHLGRSFGDFRLLDDQAAFLDWLVATTESEAVDLVVVAGDLYDRAIPPADAVSLFSDTVRRLRAAGAEVAAIAGNHDSGERIGAFDGLVDAGGVIIRGGFDGASNVTVREFHDGPLAIVATPFLEPLLTPAEVREAIQETRGDAAEGGRSPRLSHEMVLGHALQKARAAVAPASRSLVLAHAFVTGAAPSDSERDLAVGDSGMVSASIFEGFDYVALGHLHRPQRVAGTDHIRYSGSPLAYSFSEDHTKSVVMVEMDAAGRVQARDLPIPVGRGVQTVRGCFDDLMAAAPVLDAWIRVELTDTIVIPDAHKALKSRFPWLAELHRVGRSDRPQRLLRAADLDARTPDQLARQFFAEVSNEETSPEVGSILDHAVHEAATIDGVEHGAA